MVSAIDKYVIEKVKEKRTELGITQTALAYELDLSPGFIGKIESGKYAKKYNVQQINLLAILFKCSPRDLLPERPLKESKK